jgi:hypothetical protein
MSKANETSLLDQELLKSVLHERNHLKDPLQFAAWKSRLEQTLLGTGASLDSPQALSLGKLCVHYTIHNQLDLSLKTSAYSNLSILPVESRVTQHTT